MFLSCSDEYEVCDINIDYNGHLFSMNDCIYDYNYKLNVNNNNDICECAYYLPEELKAKIKKRPEFSVVYINWRRLLDNMKYIYIYII